MTTARLFTYEDIRKIQSLLTGLSPERATQALRAMTGATGAHDLIYSDGEFCKLYITLKNARSAAGQKVTKMVISKCPLFEGYHVKTYRKKGKYELVEIEYAIVAESQLQSTASQMTGLYFNL
jgi:hypothetical protein